MRTIGEIPHPVYKITLFYHQERYSVQIENGVYVQTFRIRTRPGLEQPQDAFRLIDNEFLRGLAGTFEHMHALWQQQITRLEASSTQDEFDAIL
jgi:hypothetical protein